MTTGTNYWYVANPGRGITVQPIIVNSMNNLKLILYHRVGNARYRILTHTFTPSTLENLAGGTIYYNVMMKHRGGSECPSQWLCIQQSNLHAKLIRATWDGGDMTYIGSINMSEPVRSQAGELGLVWLGPDPIHESMDVLLDILRRRGMYLEAIQTLLYADSEGTRIILSGSQLFYKILMELVSEARRRLVLAYFEVGNPILNLAPKARDDAVRYLVYNSFSPRDKEDEMLEELGSLGWMPVKAKIHMKVAVSDDTILIGSHNLSSKALLSEEKKTLDISILVRDRVLANRVCMSISQITSRMARKPLRC